MFNVWQGLGLKNHLQSSLSLYFPLCCLAPKIWFPKPSASHYSSSVKFFLEARKCHINQASTSLWNRGWNIGKRKQTEKKNVNSITSWLPGASYLISLCLPGCKFLRSKGCLNKCFVTSLSEHHTGALAQWQICHGATFQRLYVSLCNATLRLICVTWFVFCKSKTKIKKFAFDCHPSGTNPLKLVPNLTSNWSATQGGTWVKWVFNLFTLSFFMLRFCCCFVEFQHAGQITWNLTNWTVCIPNCKPDF